MSETWDDVQTKTGGDGKDLEVPPDGAIAARICALVDCGFHDARDKKGAVYQRRILIMGYELGEVDSKGKPFFMTETYGLTLDTRSTLFAIVKSLAGEQPIGTPFNPGWLANKPCLLQITHDTKIKNGKTRTYANIESVGKPPRGMVTPPGDCLVWRISERASRPLPDVSYLPPKWNENVGRMLTIPEWVAQGDDGTGVRPTPASRPNPSAVDQVPVGAESDVPF